MLSLYQITQSKDKTFQCPFSIAGPQACSFVSFVPSSENTPLQRAEWIKHLHVFRNMEPRATQENYMCLTKVPGSKPAAFKPIVAWMELDGVQPDPNNNHISIFSLEYSKMLSK